MRTGRLADGGGKNDVGGGTRSEARTGGAGTGRAAAGGGFTAAGSFGTTPGHQDVVVWTSANGATWKAVMPTGPGLNGPGIQAMTALTAAGSTLTGVGYIASPAGEQPLFWQSPIR